MSAPGEVPSTPAVRAFVAVSLDPAAEAAARWIQHELARRCPAGSVRWTPSRQFHVTLRFLGNVPCELLAALTQRLAVGLADAASCDLAPGPLGAFPSAAAARVLWAGLEGDVAGLVQLHERVTTACVGLGDAPPANGPFHPHLTLGCVVHHGASRARNLTAPVGAPPSLPRVLWHIDEVRLYESRLGPAGATHLVLARFPLRSPTAGR